MLKIPVLAALLWLHCFNGHLCNSNVRDSFEFTQNSAADNHEIQKSAVISNVGDERDSSAEFSSAEYGDSDEINSDTQLANGHSAESHETGNSYFSEQYGSDVEGKIEQREETDESSPENEENADSDVSSQLSVEASNENSDIAESDAIQDLQLQLTQENLEREETRAGIYQVQSNLEGEIEESDTYLHPILQHNDKIPENEAAFSVHHQTVESNHANKESDSFKSNQNAQSTHLDNKESYYFRSPTVESNENEESEESYFNPQQEAEIDLQSQDLSDSSLHKALEDNHEKYLKGKKSDSQVDGSNSANENSDPRYHVIVASDSKIEDSDLSSDPDQSLHESNEKYDETSHSEEFSEESNPTFVESVNASSLSIPRNLNKLSLEESTEQDRPICQERVDLYILLDASDVIEKAEFERVKVFFGNFVLTKSTRSRIGFIAFSNRTEVIFPLNNNLNPNEMKDKVLKIEQSPPEEYTMGLAMLDAIKFIRETSPKYRGAPRVIAIFSTFPTLDNIQDFKVCEIAAQVANLTTVVTRIGNISQRPPTPVWNFDFDLASYEGLNSAFLVTFRSHICTIPQILRLNDVVTTDELRYGEVRYFAYNDTGLEGIVSVTLAIIKGYVIGSYYDQSGPANGNFFEINDEDGNRNFTVTFLASMVEGGPHFKIEGSAENFTSSYTVKALFTNYAAPRPFISETRPNSGLLKSSANTFEKSILSSLILQVMCKFLV